MNWKWNWLFFSFRWWKECWDGLWSYFLVGRLDEELASFSDRIYIRFVIVVTKMYTELWGWIVKLFSSMPTKVKNQRISIPSMIELPPHHFGGRDLCILEWIIQQVLQKKWVSFESCLLIGNSQCNYFGRWQ